VEQAFVDGVEYQYEIEKDHHFRVTKIDVYTVEDQHIVGVYFDHKLESVEVEGPDFNESANYNELRDSTIESVVQWAIYQIPGY
jgi:hypothetical protein